MEVEGASGAQLDEDYGEAMRRPLSDRHHTDLSISTKAAAINVERSSAFTISAGSGKESCPVDAARVHDTRKRTKRKRGKPDNPIDNLFASLR